MALTKIAPLKSLIKNVNFQWQQPWSKTSSTLHGIPINVKQAELIRNIIIYPRPTLLSFPYKANQVGTYSKISTRDLKQNYISKAPSAVDTIETINNETTNRCCDSLWKNKSLKKEEKNRTGYLSITLDYIFI